MSEPLDGDPHGLGFTGYTQAQAEAILAGQSIASVPDPDSAECANRGELIEVRLCDLCGVRGLPFEVFACQIHGECSKFRKHSQVKSCAACQDFRPIPLATDDPPAVS